MSHVKHQPAPSETEQRAALVQRWLLATRERLPALDRLPEPQRDSLVVFLDALIMAHHYAGKRLPAGGEGGSRQ